MRILEFIFALVCLVFTVAVLVCRTAGAALSPDFALGAALNIGVTYPFLVMPEVLRAPEGRARALWAGILVWDLVLIVLPIVALAALRDVRGALALAIGFALYRNLWESVR